MAKANIAINKPLIEARNSCESLVELGRVYAKDIADKLFLLWLENGKTESHSFTFAELDKKARALAAILQQTLKSEVVSDIKRSAYPTALIVTQPGPNFIVAFFGCLYAGIAAVPTPQFNEADISERISPLMNDSDATIIVADEASAKLIGEYTPPALITVERADESFVDQWQLPNINGNTVAFIQYTSGSTGAPKGVVVTHKNLISNERMVAEAMNHSQDTVFVGWLPVFHDMGLIGNLIQPFFLGVTCVMMPPKAFVSRPIRWLEAISRYKGTTSGGPNFAYELCISRTTEEQRKHLDLSSWKVAFNGAEPIRADTIKSFTQAFAHCGFKQETMYPCYGMAEGTLFISGSPYDEAPTTLVVDKDELSFDRISIVDPLMETSTTTTTLVSSGITYQDCDTRIVDPQICKQLDDNQVGEIWVSSTSIASGYKNLQALTNETFHATIKKDNQTDKEHKQAKHQTQMFLRTGDLGFIHKHQLYVTGRLKDLIIVSGRNHYPQDIESSAIRAHIDIAGCQAVAFSVDINNEEKLVVVLYINARILKKIDPTEVIQNIKRNIAKEHQISLHNLTITQSRLPLTSSGKIQRKKSKHMYLHGGFKVIYEMNREEAGNGCILK